MVIDEIVVAIDPALRKIEHILLWKNKLKTVLLFTVLHFVFWVYFMYSIKTYCLISLACLVFHLLDAYRDKKRRYIMKVKNQSPDITKNICSLGRYIIWTFNKACILKTNIYRLKSRNRIQYFLLMFIFWSVILVISIKIKSSHLAYALFWIIFFLPAFLHYEVAKRILFVLLPLLQQLDQSMQYERRSVLDKSELLVDVKLPKTEYEEDYEEEDEFFNQLSEKEKRVLENLDDEEEEVDDYVDHEDIEIQEEIEERHFDHENLENVQRIRSESFQGDQDKLMNKRRVKNRPSLREYYGDKIDIKNRNSSQAESFFMQDELSGTVKMRTNKNQHDQDIDDTFDFLDEEC